MSFRSLRAPLAVAALLLITLYGVIRTTTPPATAAPARARRAGAERTITFEQTSLATAERLVRLPTTPEERPFAEEALRLADGEMDLAFAAAVRRMANQPRADTPEARAADARLQAALAALTADEAQVKALTAALAKAGPAAAEGLTDRLNLAQAQQALDQDEADDARQDLRRAGGDPQGRMQELIEAHEAASKGSDSLHVIVAPPAEARGTAQRLQRWWALDAKAAQLARARDEADSLGAAFRARHDRLEARLADTARAGTGSGPTVSHDSSTVLLAHAQQRVAAAKIRQSLDQRQELQRQLSANYAAWIGVVALQQRAVLHAVLRDTAMILAILLVALLAVRWIAHQIAVNPLDRRRAHTLLLVSRVVVQVLAVLLALLVIVGVPDNLGTLVGLAGAGLTVALKDFVVSFLGWFVLMGRNGMRIGDLVEINGVTGEVVELGLMQTELLETKDWTEAGHPTGRRVSFSNAFAIEGHYFNFSTTGRWLVDDVRVVVPAGRDPYAIGEALQSLAREATAESAREAEAQWRAVRRVPSATVPSAEASLTYKPVVGGVEIAIRFVARVAEREGIRARLFQRAVELLGAGAAARA